MTYRRGSLHLLIPVLLATVLVVIISVLYYAHRTEYSALSADHTFSYKGRVYPLFPKGYAKVFDASQVDAGQPYYAYVSNDTIEQANATVAALCSSNGFKIDMSNGAAGRALTIENNKGKYTYYQTSCNDKDFYWRFNVLPTSDSALHDFYWYDKLDQAANDKIKASKVIVTDFSYSDKETRSPI